MSSYQYYDFYAIDRPLSKDEIATIRTYSSRVKPSSRRAIFEYNYSDFRYSEEEVLNDYFDMMLYISNWGERRLLMKFPANLVPFKKLQAFDIDASYDFTQEIKVYKKGANVLIDLNFSTEDGGWADGEGLLDEMLPLREQVLNRDFRVLFLAWLHLVSMNPEIEANRQTPEIPSNLKTLDDSLNSFINFWGIDEDLVAAAGTKSVSQKRVSDEVLIDQISRLSEQEKAYYLKVLFSNEGKAKMELRKRLTEMISDSDESSHKPSTTIEKIQEETRPPTSTQKSKRKTGSGNSPNQ